jgi:two-component system phosphate regulon response regulator PhoB
MAQPRILIVEDEADIAELLAYKLGQEGFEVEVCPRGDSALERTRQDPSPDLVLLDLMLPGLDGLELCRHLRREPATAAIPIIMLTAKAEEVDRIVGLELGADDYIVKPFSPREVALRVKAVLRRVAEPHAAAESLEIGGLRLDLAGHRLFVGGEEVVLTATEFRLFERLMESPGRVLSRTTLLADAWGYSSDVDSRTVDTHVRRLRRKLGPEAERVETVIGVGYRLRS